MPCYTCPVFLGAVSFRNSAMMKPTIKPPMANMNTFWMPVWLPRYDVDQWPRACERLIDIFTHGVAGSNAAWASCCAISPGCSPTILT